MDEDALRALADVRHRGLQARAEQRIAPRYTLVRALLVSAVLLVATVPDGRVMTVLLGVAVLVAAVFLLALRVPHRAALLGVRALSRTRRPTRSEALGAVLMGAWPALVSSLVARSLDGPYPVVVAVVFAAAFAAVVVGDLCWNRFVVPSAGER